MTRCLVSVYFFWLFVMISLAGYAQVPQPSMLWMKSIGGNGGDIFLSGSTKTPDGGILFSIQTGSSSSSGNIGAYCSYDGGRVIFAKYNSDATILEWSKCYVLNGDSFLIYLFPLPDGGVILGGQFKSSHSYGWLVTKHDAAGNVVWQHNYSKGKGAILRAMMATEDGGYIMTGGAYQTDTNVVALHGPSMTSDIWVLKVDQNGNKVWSRVIGGSGDEGGAALVPAPGDGVYVVGGTGSYDHDCTGNPGGGSAYVARLDKDGNKLWHRCLGGSKHDAATAACSNNKGGVILAVNTSSWDHDVHNYHGGSDFWAVEVDSSGVKIWDNCYGTASDEVPQAICKATDGSVWINGFTNEGNEDVFMVRADEAGNIQSSSVFGSSTQDRGQMIHPLLDGFVIAGGYYYKNDGAFSALNFYSDFLTGDIFLGVYTPWRVEVTEKRKQEIGFKIRPNPANGLLYIETGESSGQHTIVLCNMEGKQVHKTTIRAGETQTVIDVSGYAKGLYYVRVKGDEGDGYIGKVVIE